MIHSYFPIRESQGVDVFKFSFVVVVVVVDVVCSICEIFGLIYILMLLNIENHEIDNSSAH